MARRVVCEDLPNGTLDVRFEEYDPIAEREQKARAIAADVQGRISEAYQSPFTLNAALEAARIALIQASELEGEA